MRLTVRSERRNLISRPFLETLMDEPIWMRELRSMPDLALSRFESVGETGSARTLRVTRILKLDPDGSERALLDRFAVWLGKDYENVFPRFRVLGFAGGASVIELEYLADTTLEQCLLAPESTNRCLDETTVASLLDIFSVFAAASVSVAEETAQAIVEEVIQAVVANATAADRALPSAFASHMREHANCVPKPCHRDLSTANVMCLPDGTVRLIDPRVCVPGASGPGHALGSLAIDLAALEVSLERKAAERERAGQDPFGLTQILSSTTQSFMQRGLFNQPMLELCRLHVYSVYAACRCNYCLAPDRHWLYDLMKRRFEEGYDRIV